MTVYISISFSKRQELEPALAAIKAVLQEQGHEPFVFVDAYQFSPTEEQRMMQQAFADIDHCDLLLAETSEKGIGIGVEAGYAKGKNKPVIYLRSQRAEHSTTVAGLSDYQVIYEDTRDLKQKLSEALEQLQKAITGNHPEQNQPVR